MLISVHKLNGYVNVSCYLYATEDISNFKSSGFIQEYAGYSFDIDKFDILAVDDGFKFKIELDPTEDDKVASIFMVVKKESSDDLMECSVTEKSIVICLPATFYDSYNYIKMKKDYNNIAFAILAIPVLSQCLNGFADYKDIKDILDDYPWFNAVCISYKRKTGKELDYEEFKNMDKLKLAQMVLNDASCNGLRDFGNMLLGDSEEGIEDE